MRYFTWGGVLGQGAVSAFGVVATVVLLAGYAWAWTRVGRRGHRPSPLRALVFVLFGVLPLAVATCSGLEVLRDRTMQAAAWQVGLLLAVAPAGVALGEPVTLLRGSLGAVGSAHLDSMVRSRVAKVLAFPVVTPLLSAILALAFFTSGWFRATLDSASVRELSYAVLFGVGLLFSVPLVGELDEALPTWCTPPVRSFLAFVDGLADSVPGIVLMLIGTPLWTPAVAVDQATLLADQQLAGATLLCVIEAVGVPFLIGVLVAWMRADAHEARAFDAADTTPVEVTTTRPWWLDDPQFADRFRPPE